MKITFDVLVSKRMEFDVPAHWVPFVEAWIADDEERTEEQWKVAESHTWKEMVEELLPEDEEVHDAELYSIEWESDENE